MGVMLDLNNYLDPKSDAAKRLVGVANLRAVLHGVMSSARATWCTSRERGREAP